MQMSTSKQLILAFLAALSFFGVITLVLHKEAKRKAPLPAESTSTPVAVMETSKPTVSIIGKSIEGRDIPLYSYGNGSTHLLFVGGVHGGYEWNSTLLAYTLIDSLDNREITIPSSVTIDIIPTINPDGLFKVTKKAGRFSLADVSRDKKILESGRFNANKVDLNRNFDCKWKPKSTWRSAIVSAGTKPFSEPEALALKSFIAFEKPAGVVFWHSQANGVFASQCSHGILPTTLSMMNTYSKASGYPAIQTFDAYETTGAADDWLASINTPAITVELKTHESSEWDKNLLGIQAILKSFPQK